MEEEESGFQHRPVSMVNILPPQLTSSYPRVVSEDGRHSWRHEPTPAHHWLEVKCWDSRLGLQVLRLQQMTSQSG